MIFLVDYDRAAGKLAELLTFPDSEKPSALKMRLERELQHHRAGIEREVVLLEAADEQAIRRTHRRYFETLDQLLKMPESNGR